MSIKIEVKTTKTQMELTLLKFTEELCKRHIPASHDIAIRMNGRLSGCLGRCRYRRGYPEGPYQIEFNRKLIGQGWDEALETARHEVAHLVALVRTGTCDHGPNWKAACEVVGSTGEETTQVSPEYFRYQFFCPGCGKRMRSFNRMTRRMAHLAEFGCCSKCGHDIEIIDRKAA